MNVYVLDTNLFFNLQDGLGFAQTTEGTLKGLTETLKTANQQARAVLSPRVKYEIEGFFENKQESFLVDFFSQVSVQTPDMTHINVAGSVFAQLIEDIRERSFRGLRVGEEEIEHTASELNGKTFESKKDLQIALGKTLRSFRERYRQATRVGFLDSLADVETIFLAKELDGTIVSTDEGLLKWARIFGVKECSAQVFGSKMRSLLL